MPLTRNAFLDGRLSADHADTLCAANQPEFAALFARDEALLVDKALTMDFRRFQRCGTYWKHYADDTRSEEQASKQHAARYLELSRTFQDSVDVRGLLDPVNGAIVANELDRPKQIMFKQDWGDARTENGDSAPPEHLFRSAGQRRTYALVEMARRSAATTSSHRPARPLVSVLIGIETFAGRVCELADGTPITPGQVVPLLSDADIERVVFDTPARVIELGERERLFTGGLRRAIEVRDVTAATPAATPRQPLRSRPHRRMGQRRRDHAVQRAAPLPRPQPPPQHPHPRRAIPEGPAPPDGPSP